MISVRIWNLASDAGVETVKSLERRFQQFRVLEWLAIWPVGRNVLHQCQKQGVLLDEKLKQAIQHYLVQDNYLIFISGVSYGCGGLVARIREIVTDPSFAKRVFFLPAVQGDQFRESPAWQDIVSGLEQEIEEKNRRFQERWDKTMAHFHEAFAGVPEEEALRDIEEALAEVRRERRGT